MAERVGFKALNSLQSRHASLKPYQGDGLNLPSGYAVLQFLINGVAPLASGLNDQFQLVPNTAEFRL
jgi:hypothetical protein